MPMKYRMNSAVIDISSISDKDDVRTATLSVFLKTLDEAAHMTGLPPRVQWVQGVDTDIPPWPEPDFSFLYPGVQAPALTEPLVRTFFNLLRFPRYFEGGLEYGVDSCIQDALIHIFNFPDVVFQSAEDDRDLLGTDVPDWRKRTSEQKPILVINFARERMSARRALARAALPGVQHFMHQYFESNGYSANRATQRDDKGEWLPMAAQPAHHFVYGIHCAEGKLTIYAHFAALEVLSDSGIRSWRYYQVPVETYGTQYPPYGGPIDWRPDIWMVMTHRWQLIVALFTIRRHVIVWNSEVGTVNGDHSSKQDGV